MANRQMAPYEIFQMDVSIFLKTLLNLILQIGGRRGGRPPFVSCFTAAPCFKAVAELPANHFLKLRGHWINDVFI